MPPSISSRLNKILSPAKTYVGLQELSATLHKGTCVQLIAATGMDGNDLTISLVTPFGVSVPAPPPGKEVVLSYCVKEGGPHTGTLTPALAGPFTSAAIICPRKKMP